MPTDDSELDAVLAAKEEGTKAFKDGRLADARKAYSAALAHDPKREHPEAHIILANRALMALKLSQPEACEEDCTASLQINPYYGKALFRRAQAHEMRGSLADAFKDVRELMRLEPANKEATALAAKLKRAIEERAKASDLSTPMQAVEALRACEPGSDEQTQAVGKLSRIAEDSGRARELLHCGAVDALVALLPASAAEAPDARALQMPLVGLAVEALDRLCLSDDADVLRAVGGGKGDTTHFEFIGEGIEEEVEEEEAAAGGDGGAATTAERVLAVVR